MSYDREHTITFKQLVFYAREKNVIILVYHATPPIKIDYPNEKEAKKAYDLISGDYRHWKNKTDIIEEVEVIN